MDTNPEKHSWLPRASWKWRPVHSRSLWLYSRYRHWGRNPNSGSLGIQPAV